ncbi:MAG: hypothetical protein QOG91_503 [Candidatus Parcubacteria bacterium]|nr:hypothetical protein [Candidatus Parcubacteria bacterium]
MVEIVVAAAIIVSMVTAAAGAWQLYLRLSNTSGRRTQAVLLSEEAAEALNLLRDRSWAKNIAALSLDTPYYIYWNGTTYATSTTPVTVNNSYNVYVTFGALYRDINKDIAGAGTIDARSRYATVTVSVAGNPGAKDLETQMLIHDIFQN